MNTTSLPKIKNAVRGLTQYLTPVKGFKRVLIGNDNKLEVHYSDDIFLASQYTNRLSKYDGYQVEFILDKK